MLVKVLILAIVIFLLRKSRPVKNKQGTGINNLKDNCQANFNDNSSFTVATFNIQTGKNLKGERDITRSAEAIKGIDLIGIQEVYAPCYLSLIGLRLSQVKILAENGRFGWLMCSTRRRWLREFRGNLLLSKLMVSDWRIIALPDKTGKRYRNMTVAKVIWQEQSFHFINTHLHTRSGCDEQMKLLFEEFSKYPKAILVGDFNSKPSAQRLKNLFKDKNITDVLGTTKVDPNEDDRLDWIITKGFKVHSAKVIEKGISDHPLYQATVSFI